MDAEPIARARVLVARAVFADVLQRLRQHFEVQDNQADAVWTQADLVSHLQGMDGVFVTGTKSIDACPQLRAVCSMAVGYNNIDLADCTARHRTRGAGEQRAGRAHRDHRRLRLRAE